MQKTLREESFVIKHEHKGIHFQECATFMLLTHNYFFIVYSHTSILKKKKKKIQNEHFYQLRTETVH